MKLDAKTAVIVVLSLLVLFLGFEFYKSKTDATLSGVRAAASDVEGALSVGVTFVQFGEKLQKLAAEILIARDKGASRTKVEQYEKALQIYKDSYALWDDKIQHHQYYENNAEYSPVLSDIAKRYGVTVTTTPEPGSSIIFDFNKERDYNNANQMLWKKAGETVDAAK
jgi:hypothetical protein